MPLHIKAHEPIHCMHDVYVMLPEFGGMLGLLALTRQVGVHQAANI